MMDVDKKLELAYRYCKPLKVECIKKELEAQLEGYTFKSIEGETGEWTACFEGSNGEHINLSISLDSFSVLKTTDTRMERIAIDGNLLLTHRVLDKRQNGIVYSIIQKQFVQSNRFKQFVLTDLAEQRFTLTRDGINGLSENVDFDNARLCHLFLKLRMLEGKVDLKSQSDYYSKFSTHTNYYLDWEGGRKIKDNIYPTRTYLNGEEVSSIFDVDGPDKLYRIYDLYNGIINSRNENDINSIHLGFLSQDTFNFKELKGISKQEDALVGPSLVNVPDTYTDYLAHLFDQKFGYKGNIGLDRNSMLLGITYQMSGPEVARQELDDKIDELTSSSPKRLLKRFLRPFNKK